MDTGKVINLISNNFQHSILYEDKDIIIIDKAVNVIVHGKIGQQGMLLEDVRKYLTMRLGSKPIFLAPSNRLDRNTCGPVVFSKNKSTALRLRKLFTQCRVQKIYRARLIGELKKPLFVQADIIRGNHKKARVDNIQILTDHFPDKLSWFTDRTENSRTISATVIKPLEISHGSTMAEIYPWTGRYHQIRAICHAIGFPISGDQKYNKKQWKKNRKKQPEQWITQALQCKYLSIEAFNISVESRFNL